MKQYYVMDGNIRNTFKDVDAAKKWASEHGGAVESRVYWEYYAPYSSSTTKRREITGPSLIDAIEQNFRQIINDTGMNGLSGYKLTSVVLEKTPAGADLVVDLVKLGRLGAPGDRAYKKIKIEGVEPEDMPEDRHEFELV